MSRELVGAPVELAVGDFGVSSHDRGGVGRSLHLLGNGLVNGQVSSKRCRRVIPLLKDHVPLGRAQKGKSCDWTERISNDAKHERGELGLHRRDARLRDCCRAKDPSA